MQKEINLKQLPYIKCDPILAYPFYPITATYLNGSISYVITISSSQSKISMRVIPYLRIKSEYKRLDFIEYEIECLPRRNVCLLNVLNMKDELKNENLFVKGIQFVVGFNCGYLCHCLFVVKNGKRSQKILNRLNKSIGPVQSIWARMNSALFQEQEFYKPEINKPIFGFKVHPLGCRYRMSYLVGKRLFLSSSISEQMESQAIRQFNETEWETLEINKLPRLKTNSTVMNLKRFKALITMDSMLIEWVNEIGSEYVLSVDNRLIIVDRDESKIIVFDILGNMKQISTFSHDLDIKKIQYYEGNFGGREGRYLIIIPYDICFYVLDLLKESMVCIGGHRSFVGNVCMSKKGSLISGGLDHRILILFWEKLGNWVKLESMKNEWNLRIESNQLKRQKTSESYFLGEFKNVNQERNNNIRFGFANFMGFGNESQIYAFITYDHFIKVYEIKA